MKIDISGSVMYNEGKGEWRVIVMQYGCGRQQETWRVTETRPPQYVRMYWMDGGDVIYRDDFGQTTLKTGNLYVFPAQQAYCMRQRPENPISCLFLHADVFPYLVPRLIEICPEAHPELAATLKLLRSQVEYPKPNDACVEAFGTAVLQLLVRDGFFYERIDNALMERAGLSAASSVAEASRRSGYSQEHFIRIFTKTVGVTPYQYILSQRMNEAISLMSQGLLMDDIAARLGYASGKSFAGAFKRRFGIAPNVYREHFLRKA